MAIYRKEHLAPYLAELDTYYAALRAELAGSAPSTNVAHLYNVESDQFRAEFADVNVKRVIYQVNLFKTVADYIKGIKGEHLPPSGP